MYVCINTYIHTYIHTYMVGNKPERDGGEQARKRCFQKHAFRATYTYAYAYTYTYTYIGANSGEGVASQDSKDAIHTYILTGCVRLT